MTKKYSEALNKKFQILEECKALLRSLVHSKTIENQKKIIEEQNQIIETRGDAIQNLISKANQLEMDHQCLQRLISNKDARINELEDILRPMKDAEVEINVRIGDLRVRKYLTNEVFKHSTTVECLLKEYAKDAVLSCFYKFKENVNKETRL